MQPPPRPPTITLRSVVSPSRMDRTSMTSPVLSVPSVPTYGAGKKRKARDFEHDDRKTQINVVVRRRSRNEHGVRENSKVVLQTKGVKGTSLELPTGPSARSNKTYCFDRVFSSAADQSMIYDDVAMPILDEVNTARYVLDPTNVPRRLLAITVLFSHMDRPVLEKHIRCLVI
jgi:kinesin family protein 11